MEKTDKIFQQSDNGPAELALIETRAQLQCILESTADGILTVDDTGKIIHANRNFVDMWRVPQRLIDSGDDSALLETAMGQLLDPAAFLAKVKQLYRTNALDMDTLYFKDGRVFERYTAPLIMNGRTAGRVWSFRDVTQNRRTEAEKKKLQDQLNHAHKLELVGRLASGVAHDFNNLLMGIMGYADICRDGLTDDHPVRSYLNEISREATRSANLTRQLLAFARKQPLAPRILNINDAINDLTKLLRRLIGRNIELVLTPGAGLWNVRLDPSQIDQILTNLCVNSRDAITGTGRITIETANCTLDRNYCNGHEGATPGDYVVLSITDNGSGMTKDIIDHIFEPFFTTKEAGAGTGLGLATVSGIVRQSKGFIDVRSEPGSGTVFRIHLPRVNEPIPRPPARLPENAPRGRGETVLLVEDEQALRMVCGIFLKTLNYRVLAAANPEEALIIASQTPDDIHLLLTDVIMPGIDGLQLADRLKSIKPGIAHLFMSGYTVDVISRRGVADAAAHFIQKPFSREDLARRISTLLNPPAQT